MDLKKFLKARKDQSNSNSPKSFGPRANVFLDALTRCLERDLKNLQKEASDTDAVNFSNFKVIQDSFSDVTPTSQTKKSVDFVFLELPRGGGFLIEHEKESTLTLTQTTRVRQLTSGPSGEQKHPEFFVKKKTPLDELSVLDGETVRSSSGRTLSVEQTSEMLLTLSLDTLDDVYKSN